MVYTQEKLLVLVVEDNDSDFDTLEWAILKLNAAIAIHRCVDGEEALAFLQEQNFLPSLILLDLYLPEMDGHEFMKHIKADARLHTIPIIIWTGSEESKDLQQALQQGASGYMLKTTSHHLLLENVINLSKGIYNTLKHL